jgi:two-component sensor histidine kinase
MQVRPEQVAAQAAPEPDRRSGDEIGEVALAFAHVHRAAVRTAAEQSVMRAATAEIFVHLSRREQRLVDAVLAQVDDVERDEADPDRLEKLYQLDNLATRMARINSSLLVLGGVGAGRVRHEDVPLVKVLQAALSQVEHYRRVRMGMVDDGVALTADAVDEIVHLLAELLDNATTYSPPDSEAWMTARALTDRVVIQIGDEGVGLQSQRRAELNALLSRPPAVDVSAVRAMGLTVVAHLAMRYGIRVELRAGPKLGTIAEVEIPLGLTRRAPKLDIPAPRGSASVNRAHKPIPVSPAPAGLSGPVTVPPLTAPPVPTPQAPTPPPARRNGTAPVLELPAPTPAQRTLDETTMQLPIYSQVSGWFRSEVGTELDTTPERVPEPVDWTAPGDDAWRQAHRATVASPAAPERRNAAGLPVRTRGAHLVPGVVEVPPERQPGADRRDPDRVSAAMAAYARGVASRRRGAPAAPADKPTPDAPEARSTTPTPHPWSAPPAPHARPSESSPHPRPSGSSLPRRPSPAGTPPPPGSAAPHQRTAAGPGRTDERQP